MTIKKLPQETVDLLRDMGAVVVSGNTYYFLPYWFKVTETEGVFELHHLDNLPKELIDVIKDLRQ